MKLIFILLFISFPFTNSYRFLVSDLEFTNQISFQELKQKCKKWEKNLFTDQDISLIYNAGKTYSINPLIILLKMQQENGLVRNMKGTNNYQVRYFRACAYGLGPKWSSSSNQNHYKGKLETWTLGTNTSGKISYYRHGGFSNQVNSCARVLRDHFNKWTPSKTHPIKDKEPYVHTTFDNAATYSLFVYCPYYGEYDNYGQLRVGNRTIHKIWGEIK